MRVLIFYNGSFGERVIGNLINHRNFCISCGEACTYCRDLPEINFAKNIVGVHYLPENIPIFIDDPTIYLPKTIPENDVILAIHVHQDLLAEIPNLAAKAGTKAIIAPIEDPKWVKPGLKNQVQETCRRLSIEFAAPKPFCSLEEGEYQAINNFIRYFKIGKPKLSVSREGRTIRLAQVIRSAPCGSTYYVAHKIKHQDFEAEDFNEIVAKAHHAYPCLASMEKDNELGDTILHKAGYIIRDAVQEAANLFALSERSEGEL